MKTLFALITWAAFTKVAFADDEAVGRYQLLSGMLTIAGRTAATDHHIILRIDTKTGKTWSYAAGVGKDGKYTEFWSQIPEGSEVR